MTDYVYFIGHAAPADGPIKIGITSDLRQRLRSLQTSSAAPLECIDYIIVPDDAIGNAIQMEQTLHRLLHEKRMKGEWFSITKADIIPAVTAAFAELGFGEPVFSEHTGLPEADRKARSPGPEYEQVTLLLEKDLFDTIRDDWPNWQHRLNRIVRAHIEL